MATTTRAALNQYSDAVGSGTTPADLFIRDVKDWTKMLKRQDTPFVKLIGRGPAPQIPMHKREWGWGSPDPDTDVMNDPSGIDAAVTSMIVTNGAYFSVWDVIKVEDELMLVTAISTNTLTVTRGFAGSTAATHADALTIQIVAPAVPENVDDPTSPITQGEVDFNYHQIMTFTWQLSERARVTPTYESRNFGDDRDRQELMKKMRYTAPLRLEKACLHGLRAQGTGANNNPSAMGGLQQTSFVTTRSDMGSGTVPLTEFDLMDKMQDAADLVGVDNVGKTIMAHSFVARVIASWYNGDRRYTGRDEVAKLDWTAVDTWFGRLTIYVNYKMPKDELIVFNPDDFQLCPYASSTGWTTGKLATQGWFTKGYLRGDWTLVAQNPDSRVRIFDFSTVAGDYPALA